MELCKSSPSGGGTPTYGFKGFEKITEIGGNDAQYALRRTVFFLEKLHGDQTLCDDTWVSKRHDTYNPKLNVLTY